VLSFSSYPGVLFSDDDYYVAHPSQLMITGACRAAACRCNTGSTISALGNGLRRRLHAWPRSCHERGRQRIPGLRCFPAALTSPLHPSLADAHKHRTAAETTIDNRNSSLWQYVVPDAIVFEWQRNMVANRLANSGTEWVSAAAQPVH